MRRHRITSVVHGPNYPAVPVGLGVWQEALDFRGEPDEAGGPHERPWTATSVRYFEFAREMPDGVTILSLTAIRSSAGRRLPRYRGIGRDITEAALTRSASHRSPTPTRSRGSPTAPALAGLEQAWSAPAGGRLQARRRLIDLDGFKQGQRPLRS